MTVTLVSFALLMSILCLGHAIRKGSTKFELVASLIFSVIFFVIGIFISIGGTI